MRNVSNISTIPFIIPTWPPLAYLIHARCVIQLFQLDPSGSSWSAFVRNVTEFLWRREIIESWRAFAFIRQTSCKKRLRYQAVNGSELASLKLHWMRIPLRWNKNMNWISQTKSWLEYLTLPLPVIRNDEPLCR